MNAPPLPSLALAPYRSRAIRPLGLLEAPPLRLKGYAIHHSRTETPLIDVLVLDRAQAVARAASAASASATHHHGVGFYIVHQGRLGTWLLVNWWSDEILLHQRLFRAGASDSDDFIPVTGTLVCCTWELAVMHHERGAWIAAHAARLEPTSAYLERWLDADV